MCKLALKLGCESLGTVKLRPALQLRPQEQARQMETISHRFLNQGMRQRPFCLLLAPCSSHKRLFWGAAFFLSFKVFEVTRPGCFSASKLCNNTSSFRKITELS